MGGSDAGSVGGAGVSCGGESGSASSGASGVKRGEAGDGIVGAGGDDYAFDGRVAMQDKGERSKSLSSSKSLRSCTSFNHFLVLLAGGGRSSGEEGGVGVADGCVVAGKDTSPLTGATVTGEDSCAGATHAAVAPRPHHQWR
jgi:hypothetical protein